MKRTTAVLTPLLLAGFLLGDVVSLPAGPAAVAPRVERTVLAGQAWRPLSASEASVREAAEAAGTAAEPLAATSTGGELQTGVIETDDFTVLGLTWDPAAGDPVDLRVRVRESGTWSAWQPLATNDEGPDAGTEEYERASATAGTDPFVTAGADAVQVSVDGTVPSAPELEVVTIDPGEDDGTGTDVGTVPLSGASAASSQPAVVSRAQWGAQESLRTCTPSFSSTVKAAVVHHTAGTNNYTAAQSAGIVRGIYAYHTQSLGWCDVGYNVLVDKFGTVYEGRYGGIDKAVRGAHSGGFNNETFGVSAMGNYEEVAAPPALVQAITRVVGWKLARYGRNAAGTTTLTSAGGGTSRYADGAQVTVPVVLGHRDVGLTACPGRNLYSQLGAIRAEAGVVTQLSSYVASVYGHLLGRVPGGSEVDFWVPIARADRWKAADGFTGSEEYRRRYITGAYVDVLGRTPDASGMAFWLDRLATGKVGLDAIRPTFMDSAEFYQRAGGTDGGFVGNLYSRALSRQASSSDITFWTGQLRTSGRAAVISSIYGSPESARNRVDRAYRQWLGRPAAASERAYWESTVLQRGDEFMRMSAMVSQEYFLKAQP
ncbi:DUF4214 domain-containing protein [Aquipuribacter hungaricus]|uniref:DUF4214 domain-containing protein n=1 Tax=Aquipuribacter hungaricus TaxID=545624 RepID=A0ABV7WKG7_9MICO